MNSSSTENLLRFVSAKYEEEKLKYYNLVQKDAEERIAAYKEEFLFIWCLSNILGADKENTTKEPVQEYQSRLS